MNDDIAGDLEWSLRVISGAVNGSLYLKKYSMYNALVMDDFKFSKLDRFRLDFLKKI